MPKVILFYSYRFGIELDIEPREKGEYQVLVSPVNSPAKESCPSDAKTESHKANKQTNKI